MSGFRIRQPRKSRGIEINILVDSIAETVRDLQAVPLKVRAKVIKKALRDWGRIVIKSAKQNVSWKSKVLKRNIIQKVRTYPKGASNARVKRIWFAGFPVRSASMSASARTSTKLDGRLGRRVSRRAASRWIASSAAETTADSHQSGCAPSLPSRGG